MRVKDNRGLMLYDLITVLSFPRLNGIPKQSIILGNMGRLEIEREC